MATAKTYSMAGVSTFNGETRLRFTSRHAYIDTLNDTGHTNIILTELPEPMVRLDAAMFIKNHTRFQDSATQAAIDEYISKQTDTGESKPKAVRRNKNDDLADRVAVRVVELLLGSSDKRNQLIDRLMSEDETSVDDVLDTDEDLV